MGLEISKYPISAKPFEDIADHGGILAVAFIGKWPVANFNGTFEILTSSSYGKRSSVRSSSDGPPHCPVSHAVAELLCWDVSIFP